MTSEDKKPKDDDQQEINFEMSELKITFKRYFNYFLSGLAILLPLIITVAIVGWLFGILNGAIGSESVVGDLLQGLGNILPVHPTVFVILGYIILFGVIAMIGFAFKGVAKDRVERAIKNFIGKIPIIGKIYSSSEQVIDILKEGKKHDGASTLGKGVIFDFAGVRAFGFLTSDAVYDFGDGKLLYYIFMPSAPVPASGMLYYVPVDNIIRTDITFEQASKILASVGFLAPKVLPEQFVIKSNED